MSLRSMTGFGRGEDTSKGLKVEVELGSVNRKQFDARIALPRSLAALEPRILKLIHEDVSRGHVSGVVRLSSSTVTRPRGSSIDTDLASAYVREFRKVAKKLGLTDDLSARSLLYLRDAIQQRDTAEDAESVWPQVRRALRRALKKMVAMKDSEGRVLGKNIASQFRKLKELAERIRTRAPKVAVRHRQVLRNRLKAAGVSLGRMDSTLAKEVAIFADRSDITEELVRLQSHFKQAGELMAARDPSGRSLDFLCQEMFREINTVGSKANDAGISRSVIQFKTALERVREQVQNVE